MTRTFTTNLRCGACVAKIKPALDAEPGLTHWSVELDRPEKTLTVVGDAVSPQRIRDLLGAEGYQVNENEILSTNETATSYYPIVLIVSYLLGVVLLVEWIFGNFDAMRAMANFMAGFFLVFSFFKLLDLHGFADSYAMYDLVAARSRGYALSYPFIELALGIAYLIRVSPLITNSVTLFVMLIGTAGVVQSLMQKRKIKCACLGSVINLPMSYVTLIEDVSMAVMAVVMLVMM